MVHCVVSQILLMRFVCLERFFFSSHKKKHFEIWLCCGFQLQLKTCLSKMSVPSPILQEEIYPLVRSRKFTVLPMYIPLTRHDTTFDFPDILCTILVLLCVEWMFRVSVSFVNIYLFHKVLYIFLPHCYCSWIMWLHKYIFWQTLVV